jgi:tetratricopeptide (TPR) repeat protein
LEPELVSDPEPQPEPLLLQDALESEAAAEPVEDLIIDPMLGGQTIGMGADSLLGFDARDSEDADESTEPLPDLTAPLGLQRDGPSSIDFEPMTLEGMEGSSIPGFSSGSSGFDMSEDLVVSLPEAEADLGMIPPEDDTAELTPDLGADALLVPDLKPPRDTSSDTLEDLENRVLDDPENPDIHLELAEKLVSLGETGRVAEEIELALAGFEDRQDWPRAAAMVDRLVQLSPDSIAHHQKRVELAYRMGDRGPLLEAYLGLGDALGKSGALDKAAAVYGRVIEHDPGNRRAAAALARLGVGTEPAKPPPAAAPPPRPSVRVPSTPAPAAPPRPPAAPAPPPSQPAAGRVSPPPPKPAPSPAPSAPPQRARAAAVSNDDFVDLGSMLRDEESRPRDTRMRVNRREPKDQDEQREFHEILEQFKRGIDENLDSEDYQSHYDLGVAFKEMGLLDEAIGEFQKALRSPDGRLRTSEALGMAFFEKGQYAACETILRKAIESLDEGDEAKIGLLYWLGRSSEAQGKEADAVRSYERAMVVDIRFLDLSQRVQRLTAGKRR